MKKQLTKYQAQNNELVKQTQDLMDARMEDQAKAKARLDAKD
jgi:hypothetical protein